MPNRTQNPTYTQILVFLCLSSLATNLCAMALPLYTLQIFDRVITSGSLETLVMLSIALFIVSAMYLSLERLRRKSQALFSEKISTELTNNICKNSLHLNAKSRPTEDPRRLARNAKNAITSPGLLTAADAIFSPIYLIFLFILHPHFGLIALTINGIQAAAAAFQIHHLGPISRKLITSREKLDKSDRETFTCRESIVCMGMVKNWSNSTVAIQEKNLKLEKNLEKNQNRYQMIGLLLRLTLQASLPAVGALLLIEQSITPGAMLAALIIGFRCLTPFDSLLKNWKNIYDSLIALRRAKSLRSLHRKQLDTPPLTFSGHISVESLSHKAGLENINFSINPGETLAVIGPNGSGKTTLLKILAGIKEYSGKTLFDQMDISTIDNNWLGSQIGYVQQNIQLPTTTMAKHICRYQTSDNEENTDKAMVDLAKRVSLHDWVMSLPERYNTLVGENRNTPAGIMQRLAIARALYGSPQLLIFDESDSAMDIDGVHAFQRIIRENKHAGKTTVFSTQRRQLLQEADYLLVLNKGSAVFYGPASSYLSKKGELSISTEKTNQTEARRSA